MIKNIEDFYKEATKYVDIFNEFSKKHDFQSKAGADHICYKCSSSEVYENIRKIFEANSEYIYQSIIAGRRIAYIKIKKTIQTELGEIKFLELSDQKADKSQLDSFDHIEVFPITFSYDDMIGELEKTEAVIKKERPHHTTHDVEIGSDFVFRCTREALVDKIKNEEMN